MRAPSSRSRHFPEISLPNTITLGIRLQHKIWGDTNIWCIADLIMFFVVIYLILLSFSLFKICCRIFSLWLPCDFNKTSVFGKFNYNSDITCQNFFSLLITTIIIYKFFGISTTLIMTSQKYILFLSYTYSSVSFLRKILYLKNYWGDTYFFFTFISQTRISNKMLNRNNNSVNCFFLCLGENDLNNPSLYMITDLVILFLFFRPLLIKEVSCNDYWQRYFYWGKVICFSFFCLNVVNYTCWFSNVKIFTFTIAALHSSFSWWVWFSVLLALICWYFGQDFPICIYDKGGSAFCCYCWNVLVRTWY